MSKNLDGIVAKIRDVRAQKRPEIENKLQKIEALVVALNNAHAKRQAITVSHPDLAATLNDVSFKNAENCLTKAQAACGAALTRLSRDCINIGVAGLSGQGKSQILRMLTGLGDSQIPTGGGSACTAVQSIVHNSNERKAVIHFLTPTGLLEKKVYPSFAEKGTSPFALGIGPRPGTLDQFLGMDLIALVPESEQDAARNQADENWDKVKDLQKALKDDAELVRMLGSTYKEIPFDEVREWLVKDNGETKHNVVEYVEIWTPFDDDLPQGLTVLDIPGLGDPTPGIEEDMRNNLKHKTDIVFFLRKAERDGSRELWKTIDHSAFDMIKEIYPNQADGIKPSDWVQLILNRDMRKEHWNEANTETLRKTVRRGFSPVVCDCGSKDAVREMVDANIDALVKQAGHIDDLRIQQADNAFAVAISAVRSLADAFATAIGPVIASSGDFDEKGHLEQFWGDLRAPFKVSVDKQLDGMREKFKEELKSAFGTAYAEIERIYAECGSESDRSFPQKFPVFSKGKLFTFLRGGRGTKEIIDRAARNQFGAVVELLRSELKECCDQLRTIYLTNVVQSVTKDNNAIKSLLHSVPEQEVSTPEAVFKALRNRLEEGGRPVETIVAALDNLLHFDVSYETQLLPYLFDVQDSIDKFDPYSPNSELGALEKYLNESFSGDYNTQAEILFNALKNYSLNWIAPLANVRSEGPCREVSDGIMRVVKANYRNFIAQFVWGEETEKEWEMYIHSHQDSLWPEEFERAASKSQLGKELRSIVAQLRRHTA